MRSAGMPMPLSTSTLLRITPGRPERQASYSCHGPYARTASGSSPFGPPAVPGPVETTGRDREPGTGLLEPHHRVDVVQIAIGTRPVEHRHRSPVAVLGDILDERLDGRDARATAQAEQTTVGSLIRYRIR